MLFFCAFQLILSLSIDQFSMYISPHVELVIKSFAREKKYSKVKFGIVTYHGIFTIHSRQLPTSERNICNIIHKVQLYTYIHDCDTFKMVKKMLGDG